uniref:Transposase n=1 Tax=Globodera rostochiensis TaxID=31243 RepID=A0A914HRV3_GLORO
METFSNLILVVFFATNLLDKAESVKLELKTFDEIFGEGWWDKGEAEDLKTPAPTNFRQNVHHQIDRQNTQIGQIEPNSTDQLGQIEPNSTDQIGQIEPNSTDQIGQIEPNSTDQGQIEPNSTDQGQIEPNSTDQGQIEPNSTDQGQIEPNSTDQIGQIEHNIAEDERKQKFDQRKAELKRDGFKNSYNHEIDESVAKELNLSFITIYKWKRKLGQTRPKHKHSHSEQKELMKRYYEIKDQYLKIRDQDIVKMLKISRDTLRRWKKQFKQHFNPNSVEANAAENVQQIENSNAESI